MSKEYELTVRIKGEVVYKRESLREIAKLDDLQIDFITHEYDDKYPYQSIGDVKTTKKLEV